MKWLEVGIKLFLRSVRTIRLPVIFSQAPLCDLPITSFFGKENVLILRLSRPSG
jgi:hypothetical protein